MLKRHTPSSASVIHSLLALFVVWVVSKIGIEWTRTIHYEQRRVLEARMLSSTMCASVEGANLAREFAMCEQAHIAMMEGNEMIYMRAFDKTMRSLCEQLAQNFGSLSLIGTLHAIIFLFLLIAGYMVYNNMQTFLHDTAPSSVYSMIAQNRMQSYIDVTPYHKNK